VHVSKRAGADGGGAGGGAGEHRAAEAMAAGDGDCQRRCGRGRAGHTDAVGPLAWLPSAIFIGMLEHTAHTEIRLVGTMWNIAFDAGVSLGGALLGAVAASAGYGGVLISPAVVNSRSAGDLCHGVERAATGSSLDAQLELC
jgi:hypothetical protein